MARRSRDASRRSKRHAPLRVQFRAQRTIAGTAVSHPEWPAPAGRFNDLAVVLHLASVERIPAYLDVISALDADVFVVVPEGARGGYSASAGRLVEVLEADPVAEHLYQLGALVNSGRLTGYRTVVRHRETDPSDLDRLVRLLGAGSPDAVTHAGLDRAGVYVGASTATSVRTGEVVYRADQLLKRVSTRFTRREFEPAGRSLSTVAIRGAVLEFLAGLQVDHQDFYRAYHRYGNDRLASRFTLAPIEDPHAAPSLTWAFLWLLDLAGLRLEQVDATAAPVPAAEAGTAIRRAQAWTTYYPTLDRESWPTIASTPPMYLGQRAPLTPGALGFTDASSPAVRHDQVALAADAGITGFLLMSTWNEHGLQPRKFLDSLGADESFPLAVVLTHPVERRLDPLGRAAAVSAWTDPGSAHYTKVAGDVAALATRTDYLHFDGRPVVIIHEPAMLEDSRSFIDGIRSAVEKTTGVQPWIGIVETPVESVRPASSGALADGIVQIPPFNLSLRNRMRIGGRAGEFSGEVFNLGYAAAGTDVSLRAGSDESILPGSFAGFETTPALRSQGVVGYNWNVATFRRLLESSVRSVSAREDARRIVVVHSWNGWGDLSQLEPSAQSGSSYLSTVRDVLFL